MTKVSLGETFEAMSHELNILNMYWKLFGQLYADEKNVKTLNASASLAAGITQNTLLDAIILKISKLTDPAKTKTPRGRVENLTFSDLLLNLPDDPAGTLMPTLEQKLDEIKEKVEPFRARRNQHIAHADKATYMGTGNVLSSLTTADFDNIIQLFNDFMNSIDAFHNDSGTAYEHVNSRDGGDQLISVLEKGLEMVELREQCMRNQISSDELFKLVRGY